MENKEINRRILFPGKVKPWSLGIIILALLFIAAAVIFQIFDIEILPSQFYGALIGVVITAIITVFLLQGQSDKEIAREKDVKIFEEKIKVYSEFTGKLWGMLADDGVITNNELNELRTICFRQLVFYLDNKQIKEIHEQIANISSESEDATRKALAKITNILQKNLHQNVDIEDGSLEKLFNSFNRNDEVYEEENKNDIALANQGSGQKRISYWHFNLLNNAQIDVLRNAKENNSEMVLNLIEYGENWRTNLIRQVKPDDIVFLLRRGGYGYIGAFRVVEFKILEFKADGKIGIEELGQERREFLQEEYEKTKKLYDMYNSRYDGANFSSNLIVEPINEIYLETVGIPSDVVRRRTIQRIVDTNVGKSLLDKFEKKSQTSFTPNR